MENILEAFFENPCPFHCKLNQLNIWQLEIQKGVCQKKLKLNSKGVKNWTKNV